MSCSFRTFLVFLTDWHHPCSNDCNRPAPGPYHSHVCKYEYASAANNANHIINIRVDFNHPSTTFTTPLNLLNCYPFSYCAYLIIITSSYVFQSCTTFIISLNFQHQCQVSAHLISIYETYSNLWAPYE